MSALLILNRFGQGSPSTIGTAQNTYATFAYVENRCKSLIAPQKHWGFGLTFAFQCLIMAVM